jgi:hypothetical protein
VRTRKTANKKGTVRADSALDGGGMVVVTHHVLVEARLHMVAAGEVVLRAPGGALDRAALDRPEAALGPRGHPA